MAGWSVRALAAKARDLGSISSDYCLLSTLNVASLDYKINIFPHLSARRQTSETQCMAPLRRERCFQSTPNGVATAHSRL